MMQTIGSLLLILALLLPVVAWGYGAFWKAMDAHADYYRYEQTHHVHKPKSERVRKP